MKVFRGLVLKECLHVVRDVRTMLVLFGMPVVLMLLFGFALTNDVRNVRVVLVSCHADDGWRYAVDRLANSQYFDVIANVSTPSEAERMIRDQKADMAMVWASDHVPGYQRLQLIVDGSDPNMARQWVAYAQQTMANAQSTPVITNMLYNPQMKSAYNFVPAIMGMLLMLMCAMMTSVSIVREKERGTMEVLLVSPVRPLMVMAAKCVPYMVMAFAVLACMLLMARLVLGVPLSGSVVWIIVVSAIYILLALSLGLLISNIAASQLMALLLSAMVLLMPIVMLSGMIFPIESMPEVLQWVSAAVPPRYYIEAMRKLMVMGVGIGEVGREVAILSGMTLLVLTVALGSFKNRLE